MSFRDYVIDNITEDQDYNEPEFDGPGMFTATTVSTTNEEMPF